MKSSKFLDFNARLLSIVALAPLLLTAMYLAGDSSFEGKPIIHALGQLLSAVILLFCGTMLLKSKSAAGNNSLIAIGIGILGASVLDLCHGFLVIPSYRPGSLEEVVFWGWFPSRIFLPLLLCTSLLIAEYEKRYGQTGSRLLLALGAVSACFVLGSCLFFLLLPVPMPEAYFPERQFPRPAEFLPAALFCLAFAGFLFRGTWRTNVFEYNLLLALLTSVATHALLMPYAQQNFDSFFAAAVLAKIISYAFLMFGMILLSREGIKLEAKEEKLRYRAIVDMASDGILTFDTAGVIASFNPAAEKLFGYSEDEILGEHISTLRPKSYPSENEGDESDRAETGQVVATGQTREVIGGRKNGSTFPMEFVLSDIRFSDTQLFMGIVRDISVRTRHLEELETARFEADEANRAKSEFLATMSHEIRTPLNGVISMTEVLQQSGLQAEQVEMADLIRQSGDSLLAIVEDILDFSKIEAGKMDIDPTPISVASLVEGVCNMLRAVADDREVDLTLFIDPEIPDSLLVDGLRLRQVLTNLVNNAIKFSAGQDREGRVSVRVVLAHQEADKVTIEFQVIDNGIGMDEATQVRIFTAFTQADSSTSRRFGGSGLGLAISQRLIDLMGGKITLQSVPDEGTTFSAQLPFDTVPSAPQTDELHLDLSGLSCVLISSPGALGEDIVTYLVHAGATVEQLTSAERARVLLAQGEFTSSIWIFEDDEGEDLVVDNIRAAREGELMTVLVQRGNRQQPRAIARGVIQIDRNAMVRSTFLKAVAMAAGRASSEVQAQRAFQVVPGASISREQAVRQKQLILVAEDNETNQKVILHQLTMLGYAADVAGNGSEALQCWRDGDYALLLTDLQMPEMDGFELTIRIRAEEGNYGRKPIAALTANILVHEAEHCRAVGMDEYLSKPTTLADLRTLLKKWLPVPDLDLEKILQPGLTGASDNSTPACQPPPVDVSILEEMVGGDPQVITMLLDDFRITASAIAAEISSACNSLQSSEAAAAAHKLKSAARAVGALALGELCLTIEKAGLADQSDLLTDLLEQFNAELAVVDGYLANLHQSHIA